MSSFGGTQNVDGFSFKTVVGYLNLLLGFGVYSTIIRRTTLELGFQDSPVWVKDWIPLTLHYLPVTKFDCSNTMNQYVVPLRTIKLGSNLVENNC